MFAINNEMFALPCVKVFQILKKPKMLSLIIALFLVRVSYLNSFLKAIKGKVKVCSESTGSHAFSSH